MRWMKSLHTIIVSCVLIVVRQCSIFLDMFSNFRRLSINLGGGRCKWTPPNYQANKTTPYFKTLIAGYPGGAKRIVYSQVEGLTGLSVNDEWPDTTVKPNHPFMKANYPHHEGHWTWDDTMDQVMLVMRNPRHAIIEYHDVLNDINYATSAESAYNMSGNLYRKRAPLDEYLAWRDNRTLNEIHWYGWFIDYWMEAGLLRDIPSHRLTTTEHFKREAQPGPFVESGRAYEVMVGNMTVSPTYDIHCVYDLDCEPVAIISIERLLDPILGPNESNKIAEAIDGKLGMTVIESEARKCVWRELVVNKKGVRNMLDRTGPQTDTYIFTDVMHQKMIDQLNRLKTKYSASEWSGKATVQDLLSIIDEYITDINLHISTNATELVQ